MNEQQAQLSEIQLEVRVGERAKMILGMNQDINRLTKENEELKAENERLQKHLDRMPKEE